MASPTVQARGESAVTTSGTTHAFTLPTGITAGDLLIAFLGFNAATTATWPGDWTALTSGSQARHLGYKVAAGGDSLSITSGASSKSSHLSWRITGHEAPATQAPEFTSATATSLTPDPPSITPTGGSKDYLILAMFRQAGEEADDDTWCNSAPTNYTNLIQVTSGIAGVASTNCSAAGAERQITTATEDPGTFSVDQSLVYHALTVAIHPAAATATSLIYRPEPLKELLRR